MQNPPRPPDRPGYLQIDTALEIKGVAPDHMRPGPRTSNDNRAGPFGHGVPVYYQNLQTIRTTTQALDQDYQNRLGQLPQAIEVDLANIRSEGATHPVPPVQSIVRELGVLHTLHQRKANEFHSKTLVANEFYGGDPFNRHVNAFMTKATTIEKWPGPNGIAMQALQRSLHAANDARVAARFLQVLNQRTAELQNTLAVVQAAEQARLAAEAQRVAAERARIAAEQQRQRELAEAARVEQARLAALAETQRLANEYARIAAEQQRQREAAEAARLEQEQVRAREQLAAEQAELVALAQEKARIAEVERTLAKAKAKAKARARAKARAAAKKSAAEQARLQTEMKRHLEAVQQQERQAPEVQHVYPASGATASTGPVVSFASQATRLSPTASSAILNGLRTGLQTLTAAGSALISGPVLVGFAALLAPSRLGNGERFSMSVPLAELSPESAQTLREIADRQGTLELPVGLGVRRRGAGTEVFVATSDDFQIRSSVLVLNAAYNLLNDVYETALPDSPTDFLTWTPAISPGNSSTALPIAEADAPAYAGAPIVPIEGRVDLNPILVEGWERFIIVFPDDSGIAPLYVVFSSPYPGATTKGKYSGRDFNPEEAGGPILDLDWRAAVITQAGIDAVKLHIARLDQSDANDIMIQRLEKILSGHWMLTDTDLRYYTHEIRELERFRAMGLSDEFKPESGSPAWNNAHTATLEDYKLGSDDHLLYSPEAIQAGNRQIDRIYEQLLKGNFQ